MYAVRSFSLTAAHLTPSSLHTTTHYILQDLKEIFYANNYKLFLLYYPNGNIPYTVLYPAFP